MIIKQIINRNKPTQITNLWDEVLEVSLVAYSEGADAMPKKFPDDTTHLLIAGKREGEIIEIPISKESIIYLCNNDGKTIEVIR